MDTADSTLSRPTVTSTEPVDFSALPWSFVESTVGESCKLFEFVAGFGFTRSSALTGLVIKPKAARPRITPQVPQRLVFRIDPNARVSLLNFIFSP